jgi:hypothetical protein
MSGDSTNYYYNLVNGRIAENHNDKVAIGQFIEVARREFTATWK